MKLFVCFILLLGAYSAIFSMENACLMCLGRLNEAEYMKLACMHCYHQDCWTEWEFSENTRIALYQTTGSDPLNIPGITCPMCRNIVDYSEIIYGQAISRKEIIARVKKFFRPPESKMVAQTK